jgi:thioredoxin 1
MAHIIHDIKTMEDFAYILKSNPGLVIIKIGATWCAPCSVAAPFIDNWFNNMPSKVQLVKVDVDKSPIFYGFLKSKKMVRGIPTMLCYINGNVSYIPDEIQIGSSQDDINRFFNTCLNKL